MKKSPAPSPKATKRTLREISLATKMAAKESAREIDARILPLMVQARGGDTDAQERIRAMSRITDIKELVDTCRRALCGKLGLDLDTSLNVLLNIAIPSQPPTSNPATRAGDGTHNVRCTQCASPAMPGDDRCYLHIK
jgi:hypothetical protein